MGFGPSSATALPRCLARITPSTPLADMAGFASSGLKGLRFVNQHDWNAVANLIAQSAFLANELALLLTILELSFALWADQDIQQLRIDHFILRLVDRGRPYS